MRYLLISSILFFSASLVSANDTQQAIVADSAIKGELTSAFLNDTKLSNHNLLSNDEVKSTVGGSCVITICLPNQPCIPVVIDTAGTCN